MSTHTSHMRGRRLRIHSFARSAIAAFALLFVSACGDEGGPDGDGVDAGTDAATDAAPDTRGDASGDAGVDASEDASPGDADSGDRDVEDAADGRDADTGDVDADTEDVDDADADDAGDADADVDASDTGGDTPTRSRANTTSDFCAAGGRVEGGGLAGAFCLAPLDVAATPATDGALTWVSGPTRWVVE